MNHLEIGITQENVLEISWERNERHNLLVNIDLKNEQLKYLFFT